MCRSAKPSNIVVRYCSALMNVGVYMSGKTCNHLALTGMLDVCVKNGGVKAVIKTTLTGNSITKVWCALSLTEAQVDFHDIHKQKY